MSTDRASIRPADPSQIRDAFVRFSAVLNESMASFYGSLSQWAEANGPIIRALVESADDDEPATFARACFIRPEDCCWRCDAAESQTEVGLCSPCHQSLTA